MHVSFQNAIVPVYILLEYPEVTECIGICVRVRGDPTHKSTGPSHYCITIDPLCPPVRCQFTTYTHMYDQTGRRGRAFHRGASVAGASTRWCWRHQMDPYLFLSLQNAAPYLNHDKLWIDIPFIPQITLKKYSTEKCLITLVRIVLHLNLRKLTFLPEWQERKVNLQLWLFLPEWQERKVNLQLWLVIWDLARDKLCALLILQMESVNFIEIGKYSQDNIIRLLTNLCNATW